MSTPTRRKASSSPHHPSANDVIAAALEAASADSPVAICAIGPVTNVAALSTARPDLIERVSRIQMMGGVLGPWRQGDGAAGSSYEFNVSCDPLAVAALFALPVPIGVVPLDVTIDAVLSAAQRAVIGSSGRLGRTLAVLMDNFCKFLAGYMPGGDPEVRMHPR